MKVNFARDNSNVETIINDSSNLTKFLASLQGLDCMKWCNKTGLPKTAGRNLLDAKNGDEKLTDLPEKVVNN